MVKNPSGPGEEITAFRDRDLAALDHPNMFLDAIYCKVRVKHRMVPPAFVAAVGITIDGHREAPGFEVDRE